MILLLLASCASAYPQEFTVYNYRSLAPIESANVTLWNATTEISGLTDIDGVRFLDVVGEYNVSVERAGFAPYSGWLNASNVSSRTYYLEPYSHAGIIKVTFVDLTLASDRRFCLYFINDRLEGCYGLNDTVILHNNMNYTWVGVMSKSDLILNPSTLNKAVYLYMGGFVGICFLFVLLLMFLGFVMKVIKK